MHRDYKKNVEATFEKMQADFNQSMKSAIADLSLNLKAEAWNALVFFLQRESFSETLSSLVQPKQLGKYFHAIEGTYS